VIALNQVQKMIKKAGITALSSLLAIALSGCGVGEAKVADISEQDEASALPVEVSFPQYEDIYASYHTTSALESDSDAPVLARVAGEVVEILVEEGSQVEQGQILARLDGEFLRLEMLQAKARLDKAKSEYARLRELHERGLVSATTYEGLKFDVDALQASYDLKHLNYGYTRIRAPIAGIVSSREIKIGRQVYVNDPTFRITDTSRLVAHLKIPQTELPKFAAGQSVNLSVDAMPEFLIAATIDRISPTIDVVTGTFRATAYIENENGRLAPGMFARFNIAYEKHASALVIPAAALLREDNIAVVYVVSDEQVQRRVIKIGIESDGMIEVLGGLGDSEAVVITGQTGLRDGSRVLASNATSDLVSG
jgi:membrane fusion protein (multidrug efflux system)